MRYIIFSYLTSPETKLGSINYLIWLDQVNGVFLAIAMTIKAVLNIIPSPLLDIFGAQFCEWIDLPGNIYMTGSFLWSALTAIYRVLFIRATTWIRRKNNEKRVLVICLTLGFVLHILLALWMTKYDAWSGFEKLCTHYSNDEINIMLAYQVDKQNWYQKYFIVFNPLKFTNLDANLVQWY